MRRPLLIIALVALAHAALYIVYQQGEWRSGAAWTDQSGYQRLGASLATTGQFTRYSDSTVFVPEVIRTPGYPAFVALVYRLFGVNNDLAVAGAQAFVFVAICWMVMALARRAADDRAAIVAGVMTALYSPLPYFGSLILTELWTAFAATAAILVCLRAAQRQQLRDYIIAGALFTATTLVRPAFVLMPFFFAIAVPLLVRQQRQVRALKGWGALAATAAVALLPWLAYNYVNLGQVTLSPAGGVGRGLWEGSWQGRWNGRLQAELIYFADAINDRAALNKRVIEKAAEVGLPAEPMLQYVNEWRDIRAVWDTPTDPMERARARVLADREYLRYAVANMREDPLGHLRRRLTTGLFVLWAADVPVSHRGKYYSFENVTGVHLPLLCEARQSLPIKPDVIALAAIALRFRAPASGAPLGT